MNLAVIIKGRKICLAQVLHYSYATIVGLELLIPSSGRRRTLYVNLTCLALGFLLISISYYYYLSDASAKSMEHTQNLLVDI